jgi:hypothetical protein
MIVRYVATHEQDADHHLLVTATGAGGPEWGTSRPIMAWYLSGVDTYLRD